MGLLSGSTFRGIVGGIASAYVDRREEAKKNIEKYQKQDEEKAKLIKEQNDVIELKRSSAKTKLLDLGFTEDEIKEAFNL